MGDAVRLFFRAKEPDANHPEGGHIEVSSLNGLPVHTTAMSFARSGAFAGDYETVPANQSQDLGGVGAYLGSLLVIPTANNVGQITIEDGPISIQLFAGGPLSDRRPFKIDVGAYSRTGPWKLTTGHDLAVLATGSFT